MRITAITKYKHGELYAILRRLGWTQSELARRSGLHPSRVANIINLVRRPTVEQADAIQRALGAAGEYLDVLGEWPETFAGIKPGYRHEQTAEVPLERLLDHPEVLQVAAPGTDEGDGLCDLVIASLDALAPRDRFVLHERYWNEKTLGAIGEELKITRARVSNLEWRAARRLRNRMQVNEALAEKDGVEL